MIVITTAGLRLPPKAAFDQPEVLRQQPLEALIGRAVLYLIAAIARQTAFEDPSRFTAVVLDELYWLTSSAEGTALVTRSSTTAASTAPACSPAATTPRNSARPRPDGLPGPGPHHQPRTRPPGLEFVGLNPDDPELLRLVTTGLSPSGNRAARASSC